MIIVMNPSAAGGSGIKKWKRIEDHIHALALSPGTYLMNGRTSTGRFIRSSLQNGETMFVAAGGDGTVNSLLNELLSSATPEQRARIQLGAIGLGSSNDFHKPHDSTGMIAGIPIKVNFHDAAFRDIGCVSFEHNGGFLTRYFLVNASIGVTAEANFLFNNPGSLLHLLKQACTPAAILAAALRTIFSYRNIRMSLQQPGFPERDLQVTNIAILKSPHVSGSFCYETPIPVDDGLLRSYVCTGMSRLELLRLLWTLSRGSRSKSGTRPAGGLIETGSAIEPNRKIEKFELSSLIVTSSNPFAVEYDGEVVETRFAQFGVLPGHLQVCRS